MRVNQRKFSEYDIIIIIIIIIINNNNENFINITFLDIYNCKSHFLR